MVALSLRAKIVYRTLKGMPILRLSTLGVMLIKRIPNVVFDTPIML